MSRLGAIIDLSQAPLAGPLSVEYCVIGSGPAGATAARALGRAGKDVLVLEEGADRVGPALTQRDGEMYDQLYMDRGGRSTADLSIAVLSGRVLGSAALALPTTRPKRWPKMKRRRWRISRRADPMTRCSTATTPCYATAVTSSAGGAR